MKVQHYRQLEVWRFLMLSQRVGLVRQAELESLSALTNRISQVLSGLRKALEKRLET